MARVFSLLMLAATVLLVGAFFLRVLWPLVFPLFFAGVLAVLFRPVYLGLIGVCRGHHRVAAAMTPMAVFLLIMLPLTGVLLLAGMELVDAGRDAVAFIDNPNSPADEEAVAVGRPATLLSRFFGPLESYLTPEETKQLQDIVTSAIPTLTRTIYERTRSVVGNIVVFAVGTIVVVLGFYYLLAESDKIAAEVQRLSPFELDDQKLLFKQFEDVCRSVVLGTIAAGLVQGVLAGLGFAMVGVERIWLLAVLTMLCALIPFMGAAMVWTGVVVVLIIEQRYLAAGFLSVYGTVIISGSDNLIKAYVIGNRARMHPYIVLVTVLGAIQFVGLWGVFLGPITAAFFYSLVNILHQKFAPPASTVANETPGPDTTAGTVEPTADATRADRSSQD